MQFQWKSFETGVTIETKSKRIKQKQSQHETKNKRPTLCKDTYYKVIELFIYRRYFERRTDNDNSA